MANHVTNNEIVVADGHTINFSQLKPYNPKSKLIEKFFLNVLTDKCGLPIKSFIDNGRNMKRNNKRIVPQRVETSKGAIIISGNQSFHI
jgi:hypothetical protein